MPMMPHAILFRFPLIPQVTCLFPLRETTSDTDPLSGGNLSYEVGDDPSRVLSYRKRIEDFYHLTRIIEASQVHGSKLLFLDHNAPKEPADGLATDQDNQALFIKTADCQSILITDDEARAIAAIHVGWRGNRNNFIGEAIQAFCENYQLRPNHLLAVRGPSLSPACAEFVNFETEWEKAFLPFFNPKSKTMDLWALTRFQLIQAGLSQDKIYGLDLCTKSTPALFSYRRNHNCGRLGGLIWKCTHPRP